MKIKWLKFIQDDYRICYKTSFNNTEECKTIDLRRGTARNRHVRDDIIDLPKPLNQGTLPLADVKVKDLLDLIPFISEYNRPIYENLKRSSEIDPEDIQDVECED